MRRAYLILKDFGVQMKRHNICAFSSSTAFFLFLSFVPMLVMLCAIVPYTPLTQEMLQSMILEWTPERVNPLLSSLISEVYDASAKVLPISAIMLAWTASRGLLALMRGLNAVNDVTEERNYFLLRLTSALYMLIMMAAIILSLVLIVFGNSLVNFIVVRFPRTEMVLSLLMNLRFVFVWMILTLVFAVIYKFMPNKKMRFKEQIPGAMFSAAAWEIFSWAFSMYVDNTNAFSIYGSLSFIIILMFWFYICIYIVLIGAHINGYLKPVYVYLDVKKDLTK